MARKLTSTDGSVMFDSLISCSAAASGGRGGLLRFAGGGLAQLGISFDSVPAVSRWAVRSKTTLWSVADLQSATARVPLRKSDPLQIAQPTMKPGLSPWSDQITAAAKPIAIAKSASDREALESGDDAWGGAVLGEEFGFHDRW